MSNIIFGHWTIYFYVCWLLVVVMCCLWSKRKRTCNSSEATMFQLFPHDPQLEKLSDDFDHGRLEFVEGTLQRINYRERTVRIIDNGGVQEFSLGQNCILFFDDQRAILRCFHPLDHVHILFVHGKWHREVRSMCAWDRPPEGVGNSVGMQQKAIHGGAGKNPPCWAGESRSTVSLNRPAWLSGRE